MTTTVAAIAVQSVGWGIQSWTLLAMQALDEYPRADYHVFANTHHEGQGTYEFARLWTPWLGEHGITVATVEAKRTEVIREDWPASVMIPAYSQSEPYWEDVPGHFDDLENIWVEATRVFHDGRGQVHRLCTHDWKITPIRHFIRAVLVQRGINPRPNSVAIWQGISWDEALRMRRSDVKYITNVYPLIDLRMTRMDCIQWLEAHRLPIPPKSACTFCPFHSLGHWRAMKRAGGEDWAEAVTIDAAIRWKRAEGAGKPGHEIQKGIALFLHPYRLPLEEAVTIPEDFGASQLEMDFCESGYCMT